MVVEVHRLLHQPKTESAAVEIEVGLGLTYGGGDMVQAQNQLLHNDFSLLRPGEDDLDRNITREAMVTPKLVGLHGESDVLEQDVLIQTQGDSGAAQAPCSGQIGVEIASVLRAVGSEEVSGGGAIGRKNSSAVTPRAR